MLRARPSRLALIPIGVVAAAIIGVQLGHSAISDINPVHFQGPLAPEGITPPPEPAPYDPFAQPYAWSMNPPPLSVDCRPNCAGDERMQYALGESAGRDPSLPYWRDATPATELQPWQPGAVPTGRTFERYMHYPVNREQAEHPLPEPASAPAPGPVSANPAEALRPPTVTPAVQEPVVAKAAVEE